MPNVQWRTPGDGQRNCPKHVEFLEKNKFGKISASVGFIKKKFVTMHGHMNVKYCLLYITKNFEFKFILTFTSEFYPFTRHHF